MMVSATRAGPVAVQQDSDHAGRRVCGVPLQLDEDETIPWEQRLLDFNPAPPHRADEADHL
jgi:hypothetical protein